MKERVHRSRYLRCACTRCPVVFRMVRSHVARAADGLACPVCGASVEVETHVEPNPPVTESQRRLIAEVVARTVSEGVEYKGAKWPE